MNENNKTNTKKETTMNNNALTNKENSETAVNKLIQPGDIYMEDYISMFCGRHIDSIPEMLKLRAGYCFLVLGIYGDTVWGLKQSDNLRLKRNVDYKYEHALKFKVEGKQRTLIFELRGWCIANDEFRNKYNVKLPTKASKEQIAEIMNEMAIHEHCLKPLSFKVKDDSTESNNTDIYETCVYHHWPKIGDVYVIWDGPKLKRVAVVVGNLDDMEVDYVEAVPCSDDDIDAKGRSFLVRVWNKDQRVRLLPGVRHSDTDFVIRGGWGYFKSGDEEYAASLLAATYSDMGVPVEAVITRDLKKAEACKAETDRYERLLKMICSTY